MLTTIAHIETPFKTKFGVPRKSGLVEYEARIVFEPEYRVAESVRGLDEFDYVWLIWGFSLTNRERWSPTVRPPRLGGNKRVGVFASRSPFRPNPIGLSSVRLQRIGIEEGVGPVLYVSGADLVDGTPIFDIKPYLPYADAHPDARGGYAQVAPHSSLRVNDPNGLLSIMPDADADVLRSILAQDPRPHYQHDNKRVYAMEFGQWEVRFCVDGEIVEVCGVKKS